LVGAGRILLQNCEMIPSTKLLQIFGRVGLDLDFAFSIAP